MTRRARPVLETRGAIAERVLHSYYRELERDTEFRRALLELQARVGLPVIYPLLSSDAEDEFLDWDELTTAQRDSIRAFVASWPLPARAVGDIELALRMAVRRDDGSVDLSLTVTRGFSGAGFGTGGQIRVVLPQVDYDPTVQSSEELDRLHQQMLRQVAGQWRDEVMRIEGDHASRGFLRPGPKLRKREHPHTVGRRLYLRAVKRKTWDQIAEEEEQATNTAYLADSIRQTTTKWARDLSIRLPRN